jgi:rhodanese-related sulfurtransferase
MAIPVLFSNIFKKITMQLLSSPKVFATAFAALAVLLSVSLSAMAQVDETKLAPEKKTRLELYLDAKSTPEFLKKNAGRVLFVDIRTRTEAMFIGMPSDVDALVPFVDMPDNTMAWDDAKASYILQPMQNFVPEMNRRLKEKELTKDDIVVLICRSGDRSSRAVNRLAEDGFKRVYTVADGFEGDMSKDGRRNVNGWKNADLPWSYKLDKSKMYFSK